VTKLEGNRLEWPGSLDAASSAMALDNSTAAPSALLCIKLSIIRASPGAHNLAISLAIPKTFALA
jgi:hypothetical protein